jgi:hypothetical protein
MNQKELLLELFGGLHRISFLQLVITMHCNEFYSVAAKNRTFATSAEPDTLTLGLNSRLCVAGVEVIGGDFVAYIVYG